MKLFAKTWWGWFEAKSRRRLKSNYGQSVSITLVVRYDMKLFAKTWWGGWFEAKSSTSHIYIQDEAVCTDMMRLICWFGAKSGRSQSYRQSVSITSVVRNDMQPEDIMRLIWSQAKNKSSYKQNVSIGIWIWSSRLSQKPSLQRYEIICHQIRILAGIPACSRLPWSI